MALPDYEYLSQGSAVIWGEDGAAGGYGSVTNTLSLDALASTKARMGDEVDLGEKWRRLYAVVLCLETGSAPTAGVTAQLWLVSSVLSTVYAGGVTGTDAAYKDGEEAEWVKQLGAPAAILVATNDANVPQATVPMPWRPSARYVTPVVQNTLGQALRDQATASNNLSRVVLVPIIASVEES
jgi:hypothetical protein